MATMTETATFQKLELRTAFGPVYRNVLQLPARDCRDDEVPVIDLKSMYGDFEERLKVSKAIVKAAENTGFFYIKNHGIDRATIDAAFGQIKTFFDQPASEKGKVSKKLSKYYNGWSPKGTTQVSPTETPDYREGFSWRYDPKLDPEQKSLSNIPDEVRAYIQAEDFIWEGTSHLPNFKDDCIKYWQECLTLSRRLVRIFALGLGLEETYFDHLVTYPGRYVLLEQPHNSATLPDHIFPSLEIANLIDPQ